MTAKRTGLRERKKQATRVALREAALRLAMERGPENVRVDDIAEAAGVSPRTYNNYFSSREHAIVAAVTADREARVAAAVADAPPEVPLAEAVAEAVVREYTAPDKRARDALLMITTRPTMREVYVDTVAIERPLADAIATRIGDTDPYTAPVLAASVAAAIRVALREWVQPAPTPGTPDPSAGGSASSAGGPAASAGGSASSSGLVVLSGSLPDLLLAALAPLAPAFDAAAPPRRSD